MVVVMAVVMVVAIPVVVSDHGSGLGSGSQWS